MSPSKPKIGNYPLFISEEQLRNCNSGIYEFYRQMVKNMNGAKATQCVFFPPKSFLNLSMYIAKLYEEKKSVNIFCFFERLNDLEEERQEKSIFPNGSQKPDLSHGEARIQELQPGLPQGWHWSNHSSRLLGPSLCFSREQSSHTWIWHTVHCTSTLVLYCFKSTWRHLFTRLLGKAYIHLF